MININTDIISKYKTDLEKEKSMLPLLLMTYIDNYKYINNLKKKKLWYGKVQEDIFKRRQKIQFLNTEDHIRFEDKELNSWIKKNKRYEGILNVES